MKTQQTTVVRVTRRFSSSAEQVFDALLDREKAGKFMFATATGKMVRAEIEPRVGGKFIFVQRRDGEDVEHTGEYLDMDRPRWLVFTLSVEKYGQDVDRVSIEITPLGSGCSLTLTHETRADVPDVTSLAEQGWTTVLDGLAKTLGEE